MILAQKKVSPVNLRSTRASHCHIYSDLNQSSINKFLDRLFSIRRPSRLTLQSPKKYGHLLNVWHPNRMAYRTKITGCCVDYNLGFHSPNSKFNLSESPCTP